MAFQIGSPVVVVPFFCALQSGVLTIGQLRDAVNVVDDQVKATKQAARMRTLASDYARNSVVSTAAGVSASPSATAVAAAEAKLVRNAANDYAEALDGHVGHLDDVLAGVSTKLFTVGYMALRFGADAMRTFKHKPQPWIRLPNGEPSTFLGSAAFDKLGADMQAALRTEANAFLVRRCLAVVLQGTAVWAGAHLYLRFREYDLATYDNREAYPAPGKELVALGIEPDGKDLTGTEQ